MAMGDDRFWCLLFFKISPLAMYFLRVFWLDLQLCMAVLRSEATYGLDLALVPSIFFGIITPYTFATFYCTLQAKVNFVGQVSDISTT